MNRGLFASLAIAAMLQGMTTLTALAGSKPDAGHQSPGHVKRAPQVFQINPTRVNLKTEPNIVLQGQNLTPTTHVTVGDRPATTVQADGYSMVVQLPTDLQTGTYQVQVTNEAGTAMADDALIVNDDPTGPSQPMVWIGFGALGALLTLLMRLARYSPIR